MRPVPLFATAALFLGAACSRQPEPEPTNSVPAASVVAVPASAAPAATPRTLPPPHPAPSDVAEPVWTDPSGWQRVPASGMRKATYKIPATAGDSEGAEVGVFYFGRGEGGQTEANIQRWISQFPSAAPSDVKRSLRTVNDMKQTIVEVGGTFSDTGMGGGGTAKPNYSLVAAVVESPAGSYFFKMTGPKKTVAASRGAFMTMLDGMKSK